MCDQDHESFQIMESTQAISWDAEEEEEEEEQQQEKEESSERSSESLQCKLEPIGQLHIFSGTHGPERDFPLYLGKNLIGRNPDCSVVLPFPSISRCHAVIKISAWDKAPLLQDCGSLNGTHIVRPPKALSRGVNHRLRDQEFILFANLPCQYRQLDVPLHLISGPFIIQGIPRLQGRSHSSRILLVEDSEEEEDFPSRRHSMNGSTTTPSPLGTVVPESDEEVPSPGVSGPSLAFNMGSDTDEELGQQSATEARTAAGIRPVHIHRAKQRFKDTKDKRKRGNGVVVGSILEQSTHLGKDSDTNRDEEHQPSGFVDSDTDVDEHIPATPVVVPVGKRQVLPGVRMRGPGASSGAHLQGIPAGNNMGMKENMALQASALERSHTTVVINSDTDDEEEVSVALTLAHLKENSAGAALWSRDPDVEEDRAQPQVLVQQSQSASGRNSDTDMEEEELPGQKRETVSHHSMDRDGALIKTHSKESQHPLRPNSVNEGVDGSQLEGNQASLVMVNNHMEMEGEAPPQPAVTLVEKYQVPVEGTHQTDVEAKKVPLEEARPPEEDWETDVEESPSSGVTDVRNSQLPTVGGAGTEWTAAVPERENTLKVGTKGRSTTAPVEQIVVYTGTRGKPTQPQREGTQTPIEREREAHVGRTKNSKDYSDDSEDLCLLATQCFVKTESESPEAVQSMEDEPTQISPCLPPQDLGLSHCSSQTQGPGALDVPWEVLDTQPFNLRDADAESQLIAINPKAHGSCSTLPRPPQQPHLVHTSRVHREPLGIQGRELQTVEKAMGIPKETAERVTPGRGLLEREVGERPPDSEQEGVSGEEELTRGIEDKSQNQVLLGRDSQRQESDKVKSSNPERDRENLKGEMAVTKNEQEKEREEETSGRERERKPDELEGTLDRKATVGKSQDRKGQIASPTLQPGVGAEDLEGLTSTLVASGSQGNEGKGAPVTSRRKQRGQLSCKVPSAEKASRDGPEFPAPCQLPIVPEASAPPQTPLTSQSQKQSVPQPLTSPFSPSEQRLHKPPHRKPSVRFQRASRMTSSPLSSAASPTEQPATPRPTSQATRSSRATRSSTRTPESVIPTSSELQPPASTNQPAIPKPPSQSVTRGRTNRSSVKTPEPVVPTGPEIQPPTSIDQPVTPSLTSRVTRGRLSKSFVKTPEPLVSSGPKLQPPTSAHQPVIPKPTSQVTRGRRNRSSAKTVEPVVPTGPELQSPTYTDQPVTPNLTSRGTQSRTSKSSIKTEPVPTTPEFQPPTSIDQPVIPKVTGQSRTLKSSSLSIAPVSTTPEQPPVTTATSAALESMTQVSHGRGRRATGKQGSRTVPIGHKPYSAVSEHESQSSTNQSSAAKSLTTTPEPAISQLPETPTQSQAPLIQNEAAGNSGLTPERKPEVSEIRKRLSTTTDSLPPQKHPRKEIFQNTVFPKEEDTAEVSVKEEPQDQAIPVPGKRKRDCAEDEPQGISSRTLRRTKPNQEAAPPKVLFTGVVDSRGERAVLSLGGSLASSVNEASYLITDRIRRTVKFLCALGKGIPILSLNWLYQSRKAGYFLPPDEYLLADAEQERNFNFSLRDSLNRARNQRLLEGYEIHVTPRVQPPPAQMGEIISYCGGTALPSMPRSYKPHRVVITCAQDLPRCTLPSRVGIPLVSSEFLLTGVLKQEATPEAFVLSSLETSPT